MTFAVWMAFSASVLVVIAILVTSVRAFGMHWTGISAGNGVLFILGSIFGEPYPFHPRYPASVQNIEKRFFLFLPRLSAVRYLLGPFLVGTTICIFGYSGTLISFLTTEVPPKLLEKIEGSNKEQF